MANQRHNFRIRILKGWFQNKWNRAEDSRYLTRRLQAFYNFVRLFVHMCDFESSFLSTTVLEAIKKQIMDEATGGVPDYTKYSSGAGHALLHKSLGCI